MRLLISHKVISVLCLTCTWFFSLAQENKSEKLIKDFNTYAEQNLEEKLYVHTDRNSYVTGEIVWFAVYLTDEFHRPFLLSKVVYVEILDRNNKPVLQAKIQMKNGFGNGSMFLPATLASDNYRFRAYTNWMKNYSADFYFNKTISVVNPFVKPDSTVTSVPKTKIEAQFFPEGGNFIAGVNNKVAFKVNDSSGNGLEFSGALINQRNDTILHFSPLKFGIGNFSFVPVTNGQYRAVIRTKGLKGSVFNLPQLQTSGYAFHLSESSNKIKVEITSVGVSQSAAEPIYLFVHTHQVITKVEMSAIEKNNATFYIDKRELAEGISHFTVFEQDLRPVCERLYFKAPATLLALEAKSDRQEYQKRQKVPLLIKGNRGDHFSVAVVRADSLPSFSSNISDYLLLSSDLKGTIEAPEYYLRSDSLTQKAQDNLMLTHGWSRFKWDGILKSEKTARFPLEFYGHIISGIVKDEAGTTKADIVSYASSPSKMIWLSTSRSNDKGEVFFNMRDFYGTQPLILSTNPKTDSLYHVEIVNPFSTRAPSVSVASLHLNPPFEKTILSRSVGMQVQDVYAKNENDKQVDLKLDSLPFYGNADEKYLLDDYTRFPVMEEVLREYVPGVMVRKHKDGFHFAVVDRFRRSPFPGSPLILLDGVPVFDEDEIMDFDPLKVKKLEVVASRYFIGAVNVPGIVSFATYRGDLAGFKLNPKSLSLNYEALQRQQEFYSPQYQSKSLNRLPDFRSLLYWNPSIVIDGSGEQTVEFYSSDLVGKYQVVIEGISSSGSIGNAKTDFTVRE